MNETNRMKRAAGLTEAKESKDEIDFEYENDPKKGKTYLALYYPYEGHSFYQVPNGTKLKDFKKGGKYSSFMEQNSGDLDFIFKTMDA